MKFKKVLWCQNQYYIVKNIWLLGWKNKFYDDTIGLATLEYVITNVFVDRYACMYIKKNLKCKCDEYEKWLCETLIIVTIFYCKFNHQNDSDMT